MQPDPGSNRGPSAYRANALPTEIPDCLHIIHPVPVLTQVTPATIEIKIHTLSGALHNVKKKSVTTFLTGGCLMQVENNTEY